MVLTVNEANQDEILAGLKTSSEKAFECIVNSFTKDLLQQAMKLTRDSDTAKDLVQDVFAGIWEKREQLTVGTSLAGYLHTTLKNKFLRHVSRASLHEQAIAHLLTRMDDIQNGILDTLAANDLQTSLSEIIGQLPPAMQNIFILRNEDYSLREIAAALGLAEQTVRSYHSELNRRIRAALISRHPDISHSLLLLVLSRLI
ncbi:RNA polymerase sigma factor [Pararcticibacter amylolyticus]|uniref:RNA polymerase subunit sigma-24 n=1 Tax=Pararcticibacter amylolyticus TaxID=2173175 RepID=A0A2U2PJB9_9SPHI|nr:sigma-70 family RNA polymerase sigma factor [Pararcticibacter amylolyticus]PWG81495.1 RNA polymerase subunit sigma-24 [Pararcticibacter amylolyticus]